jgi:hypothetical protein
MMRAVLRRALKVGVPAVLFLTVVPAAPAHAAIGPCGYVSAQLLGGAPITLNVWTYCTPAQCTGLAVPPITATVGSSNASEFVCVRV